MRSTFERSMRATLPLAALALLAACGQKKDDEQENHQQAVTIPASPPATISNDPQQAQPLPDNQQSYVKNPPLPPAKGRATPDAQTNEFLALPTGNGLQPQ